MYSDAYLPKGCKSLSIKEDSLLEIKHFYTGNLSEYVEHSRRIKRNICLVYINAPDNTCQNIFLKRYKYLRIKSFQSWIKNNKVLRIGHSIYKLYAEEYHNLILAQAQQSIENNLVTLFVGAGLGNSLNLPDWIQLISKFYKENNIKIPEECIDKVCGNSQPIKARFIIGDFSSEDMEVLKKSLYPSGFQHISSAFLEAIIRDCREMLKIS